MNGVVASSEHKVVDWLLATVNMTQTTTSKMALFHTRSCWAPAKCAADESTTCYSSCKSRPQVMAWLLTQARPDRQGRHFPKGWPHHLGQQLPLRLWSSLYVKYRLAVLTSAQAGPLERICCSTHALPLLLSLWASSTLATWPWHAGSNPAPPPFRCQRYTHCHPPSL